MKKRTFANFRVVEIENFETVSKEHHSIVWNLRIEVMKSFQLPKKFSSKAWQVLRVAME
jgi:hypothetical protein